MAVNYRPVGMEFVDQPRYDHEHPEYRKLLDLWSKCRDCYKGEESIKAANQRYLPFLSAQESDDYFSYRERALYLNVMRRTVSGLVGATVRKNPIIDLPKGMEYCIDNIDNIGTGIHEFIQNLLIELLICGRVVIVVDRKENSSPYLSMYNAESFINWRVSDRLTSMSVFAEEVDLTNDGYDHEIQTRYRVYTFDDDGFVKVSVAIKDLPDEGDLEEKFIIEEESYPTMRGLNLTELPVFCIYSEKLGVDKYCVPPLIDLANISLSHYRSSADLENGRHFTALPQPWITGVDIDEYRHGLRVGANTAWIIPNENANIGYLEFSGQGLRSLENALQEKEQMMAIAGARVLESKKGVESAETARIRQNIETSILSGLVLNIQNGINKALRYSSMWEGLNPDEVNVELNMDFVDVRIPHQEIIALVQSYQMGGISMDTLLYNLKQGEVIPDDVSIDEEREKIELDHGNIQEPVRDRSEALQDTDAERILKENSDSGRGD